MILVMCLCLMSDVALFLIRARASYVRANLFYPIRRFRLRFAILQNVFYFYVNIFFYKDFPLYLLANFRISWKRYGYHKQKRCCCCCAQIFGVSWFPLPSIIKLV